MQPIDTSPRKVARSLGRVYCSLAHSERQHTLRQGLAANLLTIACVSKVVLAGTADIGRR